MSVSLPEKARLILDGQAFVTLGTLNADGSPQLSVLWATRDDDDILLSTVIGRRKERNLSRDARVSVVMVNSDNPYQYVEVRGIATMTEDGGPELIQQLSQKYRGEPYTWDLPSSRRVVIRIKPEKITGMG